MLLWIAIGGALAGAFGRWRLAELRHDRAAAARVADLRARRRARGPARVVGLEHTGATLLGMPAYRITVALDGHAPFTFTRALPAMQQAWVAVGATLDTTYDPDDLTNFATELEGRFADELGARVLRLQRAPLRVELDAPLWALGHDGAEAWLLPPHPAAAPRVHVVAFGAAAYLAADALALTTTARPRVAVVVDPATHAIACDPDAPATAEAVVVAPRPARASGDSEVTLRIRVYEREPPPLLTAPPAELPGALADALAAAALVTPVEPPAWYRVPRPAAAAAYAQVLPTLVRQLLADPARGALAPLAPEVHGEIVTAAIAAAHAHDDGQVHLAALACAVAAARAGALTLEHRVYASELVGHYAGTGHPIDLLAPSYLVAFNLRLDAGRRLRELRAGAVAFRHAESAYHAWLARRFG